MSRSNLLLLNICATLGRMVATVFMGLWTTRIAYRELGEEGFGVYAATLALVSLLSFLIDSFGSSAQRHIAHADGADDSHRLQTVTGTFVTLSILFATVFVLAISITIPWMIPLLDKSEVFIDQLPSAIFWIGAAVGLVVLQNPFKTYLIARQSIVVVSLVEFFEAVARLAAAAWLLFVAEPSLAVYAQAIFFFLAIPTAALVGYSLIWNPDTRPRWPSKTGEIASLGGWLTIGVLSWKMRTQLAQVLISSLSGPAGTASYNIGLQIAGYQNSIRTAIYRAARPATVAAEGRGAAEHVNQISLSTSKLMGMVCLFFAAPVLIDTQILLDAWIGDVPEVAALVLQITFIWVCLKDLTIGHLMAVHAQGKVAWHEIVRTSIEALSLLGASIAVYQGVGVWAFPAASLCAVVAHIVMHVFFFNQASHTTPLEWVKCVLRPYLLVVVANTVAALPVVILMEASVTRLLVITAISIIVTGVSILTVGMNKNEQERILHAFKSLRNKLTRGRKQETS